jgi:hypothetical protein
MIVHAALRDLQVAEGFRGDHRLLALDVRCFINDRTVLTVRWRSTTE